MAMRVARKAGIVWRGRRRSSSSWMCSPWQSSEKQQRLPNSAECGLSSHPGNTTPSLGSGDPNELRISARGGRHFHSLAWKAKNSAADENEITRSFANTGSFEEGALTTSQQFPKADENEMMRSSSDARSFEEGASTTSQQFPKVDENEIMRSSADTCSFEEGSLTTSQQFPKASEEEKLQGDTHVWSAEENPKPGVLESEVQTNVLNDDVADENGSLANLGQGKTTFRSIADVSIVANKKQEQVAANDDFLKELERIERNAQKDDDLLKQLERIERNARKVDRFDDNVTEGLGSLDAGTYAAGDNGPTELSADLGDYDAMKGTESDLDDDEAIFYRDGLGFVTKEGILKIPGLGDLENQELDKPYQFRPERLYYPGQHYSPEDFDISRPAEEGNETFSRVRRHHSLGEVMERCDFRNIRFLSQYITETSRLHPRRVNMVSAKAQRKIVREIKTARAFGLIPFTSMGEPPYSFLRSRRERESDDEDEDDDGYDVNDDGRRI